ncbi:MAG TPA: NAD(P)-binding domain-containing protein [Kofleriaceae bacterium]|jgi:predicted dinucleotide-binding enzyme|nr:NAD(P)-binding domain-containing protein [Kofleriaceae bacterium]
MKIGVLGTGMVGNTIASKLVERGHDVMMGSRSAGNEKAVTWAHGGGRRSAGSFADAAGHGEMLWNCTSGSGSIEALRQAGADRHAGKILVDLANPLDFSRGMPPSLSVCNTDSLGEQIQREFPRTRVVKTLNTVNHQVMVDPQRVPGGDHSVFVCGNDAEAKAEVNVLLREFGWRDIVDLGDITGARGTEAYLLLWLRFWQATGTGDINIHLYR